MNSDLGHTFTNCYNFGPRVEAFVASKAFIRLHMMCRWNWTISHVCSPACTTDSFATHAQPHEYLDTIPRRIYRPPGTLQPSSPEIQKTKKACRITCSHASSLMFYRLASLSSGIQCHLLDPPAHPHNGLSQVKVGPPSI